MLTAAVFALIAAATPPDKPPLAAAAQLPQAPTIDGRLDDDAWAAASVLGPFVLLATAELPSQPTICRVGVHENTTYFAFRCMEDRMAALRASKRPHDDPRLWEDDCVEIFAAPGGRAETYYHLIVTAAGCTLDELCTAWGRRKDTRYELRAKVAVAKYPWGWACEVAIPVSEFGPQALGAKRWRVNVARAERPHGEYSSWAALLSGFHEPHRFGWLIRDELPYVGNIAFQTPLLGLNRVKLEVRRAERERVSGAVELYRDGQVFRKPLAPGPDDEWSYWLDEEGEGFIRLVLSEQKAGEFFATAPIHYRVPKLSARIAQAESFARLASAFAERIAGPSRRELEARARGLANACASLRASIVAAATLATLSEEQLGQFLVRADGLIRQGFWLAAEAGAAARYGPDCPVGLGWQTSLLKLFRDDLRVQLAGPIKLSAARGEWESAQLVILPLRDTKLEAVEVSPLLGPEGAQIGPQNIKVWLVGYVHTRPPVYPVERVGWWPDPLMPVGVVELKQRQLQPIWISVRVPDSAPAGLYRGSVQVTLEGGQTAAWPIELNVWDFSLPFPSRLKTAFSALLEYDAMRWYGFSGDVPPRSFRLKFYSLMLEHRLNPMSLYSRRMWPLREDLEWCIERGLNAFNICYAHGPGVADYVAEQAAWLKERGWLPLAFVYGIDEVKPEQYPRLIETFKLIAEKAPGLKRACTVVPNEQLDPYVDIWIPLTASYDHRTAERFRRRGDEVWWYICCGPWHPYANWFIDYPAIDPRILFWQAFKYRVTGFLYYEVCMWRTNLMTGPSDNPAMIPPEQEWVRRAIAEGKRWPELPWNTWTFARFNGDGLLVYPGTNETPWPSLRLEVIRDGIEDYDMLCVLRDLREKLRKASKKQSDRELAAEAAALLAIRPHVCRDLTHYTKDPRVLLREREAVARAILRIKQRLAELGR